MIKLIFVVSYLGQLSLLCTAGKVITWGAPNLGGVLNDEQQKDLNSGVLEIVGNQEAFAARKDDGTIVAWGRAETGGNAPTGLANVDKLVANSNAFAAMRKMNNGFYQVVAWGNAGYGGYGGFTPGDISAIQPPSAVPPATSGLFSNVVDLFAGHSSFAALRNDGSLIVWGFDLPVIGSAEIRIQNGFHSFYSNPHSTAILLDTGIVNCYGDEDKGGECENASDVKTIYSNDEAYAAITLNDSVITWGNKLYGGNSTSVAHLLNNVSKIYSTAKAFAALLKNGEVVAWGDEDYGGNITSGATLQNVVKIAASSNGFVALKQDGSVYFWGDSIWNIDNIILLQNLFSQFVIKDIYASNSAFVFKSADDELYLYNPVVQSQLPKVVDCCVKEVVINDVGDSFAAILTDGTVQTFGNVYGADSSLVANNLTSIDSVVSNNYGFAALKIITDAPSSAPSSAPTEAPSSAPTSTPTSTPTTTPTTPTTTPSGESTTAALNLEDIYLPVTISLAALSILLILCFVRQRRNRGRDTSESLSHLGAGIVATPVEETMVATEVSQDEINDISIREYAKEMYLTVDIAEEDEEEESDAYVQKSDDTFTYVL